jgi:hypothetical protein
MAHQLSLFVENKPGKLYKIMQAIMGKNIDVKAFTIASADTFGVIKMFVNEPVRAREMLKELGLAVALEDVVVVEFTNMPQGMLDVTAVFAAEAINIDSAYCFTLGSDDKAHFVIETREMAKIKDVLAGKGFQVLSDAQIYAL